MQEYTLNRTGRAPLAFRGVLLASSSGAHLDAAEQRARPWNRYHVVEVYQAASGGFVAHVEYRTAITGKGRPEPGYSDAVSLDTVEDVAEYLERLAVVDGETGRSGATARMLPHYQGRTPRTPKGERLEEYCRSELARAGSAFARQVSEILAALGYVERLR